MKFLGKFFGFGLLSCFCSFSLWADAAFNPESDAFWNREVRFEKLVQFLDPTLPDVDESPRALFQIFGLENDRPEDFAKLQSLLQSLAEHFTQKARFTFPSEAKTKVRKTGMFADERGPTRERVLEAFISYKVLRFGPPEIASHIILKRNEPTRQKPVIDSRALLRREIFSGLDDPVTRFLKIPLARAYLFLQRAGRGGKLHAILLDTFAEYILQVRQFRDAFVDKTGDQQQDPEFWDLPEKYQKLALKHMNIAPIIETEVEPKFRALPAAAEEIGKLEPDNGVWDEDFMKSFEARAFKFKKEILGAEAGNMKALSATRQRELRAKLIREVLSPENRQRYETGVSIAAREMRHDIQKQREKLQRLMYEDLDRLALDLSQALLQTSQIETRVRLESEKLPLEAAAKGRHIKSEIRKLKKAQAARNKRIFVDYANHLLQARLIAQTIGAELRPEHLALRIPAVRLAELLLAAEAERELTDDRQSLAASTFINALRPGVREGVSSTASSTGYPLCLFYLRSVGAKNWLQRTRAYSAQISNWTKILLGSVAFVAAINTVQGLMIKRIPITDSKINKLTHMDLSEDHLFDDPEYAKAKARFISAAIADGLDPIDARQLRECVKDTDIKNIPETSGENLRENFRRMKERDVKADPDLGDYDDFRGWNGRYYNYGGLKTSELSPQEIRARVKRLDLTINVMTYRAWIYAKTRRVHDAALSKELRVKGAEDVERLLQIYQTLKNTNAPGAAPVVPAKAK
jgi:hypothetical protein